MRAPDGDELVTQAVGLAGSDDRRAKALFLEATVLFDARQRRELASRAQFAAAECAFRLAAFEEAERLSLDVASRTVGAAAQSQAYLLAGESARLRGASLSAESAFNAAVSSALAWRAHLGLLRLALERGDEIAAEGCLAAATSAAEALRDEPERQAANCAVAFVYGSFLMTRRPSDALEKLRSSLELSRSVPLPVDAAEPRALGGRPSSFELRECLATSKARAGKTEAAKREFFSLLTELRELGRVSEAERVQEALRRLG